MKIIYTTQMRTGTHWLGDIVWELVDDRRTYIFSEHNSPAQIINIARKTPCVLFHTHSYAPSLVCASIQPLDDFYCLATTRDFKDMVCSRIFYEGRKIEPRFGGMERDYYVEQVLSRQEGKR